MKITSRELVKNTCLFNVHEQVVLVKLKYFSK